jgi:hypothetical protein
VWSFLDEAPLVVPKPPAYPGHEVYFGLVINGIAELPISFLVFQTDADRSG